MLAAVHDFALACALAGSSTPPSIVLPSRAFETLWRECLAHAGATPGVMLVNERLVRAPGWEGDACLTINTASGPVAVRPEWDRGERR